MLSTYRKIFDLFEAGEKRSFYLLTAMSLVMGVLQALGVVSIVPFIAVASDPESIQRSEQLSYLYEALGFEQPLDFLMTLGAGAFVIIVGGIAFQALTFYALTRFARMRSLTLGSKLFGRYLSQPYAWFLDRHTAQLSRAVLGEVEKVVNQVIMNGMRLIAYLAVTFCIIGLLVVVDPAAAIVAGALLGASYGLIFLSVRRRLLRIGQSEIRANRARFRTLQEAFGGLKEVKILHLEQHYLTRFRRAARQLAQTQAEKALISEMPRHALEALTFGGMILFVLWVLSSREGRLLEALPVLALYAFAGVRLFPVVQRLYSSLAGLRASRPLLDALHADIMAPTPQGVLGPDRSTPIRMRRQIEFDKVVYQYPNADRPALNELTLRIPVGTKVGIVGATGAGKTTAVDLLLGLLTPNQGAMRVDDTEIVGERVRGWRKSVGYVPQAIYLTDDTVSANIAFGEAPEAINQAAVERAARVARLDDFIRTLPKGYDTLVGERGARLSGGQRQRVGIARALYRDPDVLVFDEATSALDTVTEKEVIEAVEALSREKTIVMIAHRLSTVRRCDVIFYLEDGQVSASGDYETLVASSDRFRALHEADA